MSAPLVVIADAGLIIALSIVGQLDVLGQLFGTPPPDALLAEELGPGEAEAIALGARRKADLVIMDERKGRRIATLAYHLQVKGTAGVLVLAKHRGLVPSVRPLLEAMRAGGYYVAESLIDFAARQAGE